MPTEQFKNFGRTTLNDAGGIDADDTPITVTDGSVFPSSGDFRIRIESELMLCTSRSGNDLTVTRGIEGSTATSHSDGSAVSHVLTAASLLASDDLVAPYIFAVGASASGTGDVIPGLPTGHTTNDILLLIVQSSNETVAAPAGYQQAGPAVGFGTAASAGSTRITCFWKRHDGSESDPTVADPGDHALAIIVGIRGCPTTGTPFESAGQWFKRTASVTATASAGSTSCESALVMTILGHALDSASAVFSAPTNADLTNVTEQVDVATADGTGGGIGVISGIKASEGTFAATTATMTSGTNVASTLIFLPNGARPRYDRQVFITPGFTDTWYKPSGAKTVLMHGIAGGASGSAGRNAATASGGGGGGGAQHEESAWPATLLPSSLSIQVGAGGAATANADGAASNAGTQTVITGSGGYRHLVSNAGSAAGASASGSGGTGGNGGGRSVAAAAGTATYDIQPPGGGTGGTTAGAGGAGLGWAGGAGAGGGTTQANSGGGTSMFGGGGGGGGRNHATNFGTGGNAWYGSHNAGGATVGANGTDSPDPWWGGGGGAGGNSASGPGGSGGWPGGGGGGGGSQSGAQRGGAGGDGACILLTRC